MTTVVVVVVACRESLILLACLLRQTHTEGRYDVNACVCVSSTVVVVGTERQKQGVNRYVVAPYSSSRQSVLADELSTYWYSDPNPKPYSLLQ